MKSVLFIFLFLLTTLSYSQSADTLRMKGLGERLKEYYEAIEYESLDVQKQECDFLIESATDSLLRQFIALDIYRHYMSSPVMGAENIVVHVFDKWFSDGPVSMETEAEYMQAKTFADFNRQSLIGEKAPSLVMESVDGAPVELCWPVSGGRFRILYFYDTECARCKLETAGLRNLSGAGDYPVELYAVYSGDNRASWETYMKNFADYPIRTVHLWDPTLDSDFQRKYGVSQTPRLFLVGPDGTILGRGLDSAALKRMLDAIFTERQLDYGGPESVALYDGIFAGYGGNPSEGAVKGISDYIADRTLLKGDTLMFRQMAGDYLYYLASHAGEGIKEGLAYHIDRNILSRGDVWKSQEDSLKVSGFAGIMSDLLSRAMPGTRIPALKVPGELHTVRGAADKNMRLDRLRGALGVIIFYAEGCEVCKEQKEKALKMLAEGTVDKIFMVNMDRIMASDPSLATRLMDSFDLSTLPYVIMTDKKGTILRRYMSF